MEQFSFDNSFSSSEPIERIQQGIERSARIRGLSEKDPDMKHYVMLTISLLILGMLIDTHFVSMLVSVFVRHR